MSRPLQYGPDADANDLKALHRIRHRIETDKYRDKRKREELAKLLERTITLMMSGKGPTQPSSSSSKTST